MRGSPHLFYNDGSKGMDFDANIACPNISFATVHLCAHPALLACRSQLQSLHITDAHLKQTCARRPRELEHPGRPGGGTLQNQFPERPGPPSRMRPARPYILEETGKDVSMHAS